MYCLSESLHPRIDSTMSFYCSRCSTWSSLSKFVAAHKTEINITITTAKKTIFPQQPSRLSYNFNETFRFKVSDRQLEERGKQKLTQFVHTHTVVGLRMLLDCKDRAKELVLSVFTCRERI